MNSEEIEDQLDALVDEIDMLCLSGQDPLPAIEKMDALMELLEDEL